MSSDSESEPELLPDYSTKLHSKRVLVIGGTSGIGFAVACAAYTAGATVLITSSNAHKISRAAHRILHGYPCPPASASIHALPPCDLSDTAHLEATLEGLLHECLRALSGVPLDHIAYTAGDALNIKPLTDTSVAHIQKCGAVRFVAPLLLAKLVLQRNHEANPAPAYLLPHPDSSLTFTSGSANRKPASGGWAVVAGYGAGIEGACRALAKDLKPIRVNVVSPGAVETELFGNIPEQRRRGVLDFMRKETTTGRVGRPEDLAEAYLYCMRDGFFTGKIVASDGGRLLN